MGPATEANKGAGMRGREVVAPHMTCEGGEPRSTGPGGGKRGAMSREPLD